MVLLFWLSCVLVLYTYLGYPLSLLLLARLMPRTIEKGPLEPEVSVVVAAWNEEERISGRIENLLAQDYPGDKLEIILVSDGSHDRTAQIARGLQAQKLQVLELPNREGKAAALNAGVQRASGEIIIFCDVRQKFEADAVRQLVENFRDPMIGCVSGELLLHNSTSNGIKVEMGAYWRYEKWIRRLESVSGSVVGATGAICAIRRSLFRELPPGTLLDDVMTPMRVVMQGYRTIFDGSALAHDVVSGDLSQEWLRKVRTLAGNWQLITLLPELLVPWRNPCWWRFISHKFLRLLLPFPLALIAITAALLNGLLYSAALWVQLLFYGSAILGGVAPWSRRFRLVNLSYFFFVMNAATVAGFWRWATGRSAVSWTKSCSGKE